MLTLTPDERALLAAVIAEPESDAPRLVFADKLQENAGTVACVACGGKSGKDQIRRETCRVCHGAGAKSGSGNCRWCQGVGSRRRVRRINCDTCSGSGVVLDGREEYAEFIRLQVRDIPEHYRRRPEVGGVTTAMVHPLTTWRNELDELRRREAKIWAAVRPLFGYEIKSYWLGHASVKAEVFPLAIVRRGFVAEVRGPLESLRGRKCATYQGCGSEMLNGESITLPDCLKCHGVGRVGGVLMGLATTCPIERVEVTDRSVHFAAKRAYWSRESWGDASALPDAIYSRLPDQGLSSDGESMKGFDSEAAALAALSAALIQESRDDAAKLASVLT